MNIYLIVAVLAISLQGCSCHPVLEHEVSVTREFYIAAVEREWDYAPSGWNQAKGIKLTEDSDAAVFSTRGETTIGTVYKKVLYREFTDKTFKKEKQHPEHLGLLGPVIYGEVGDVIKVHFKNNAKNRHYSVHPHGVFYKKNAEGALYEDQTSQADKKDDKVPPGETYTYEWQITTSHGPTDSDSNCLTWVYHSHVEPGKDINTGLIGPLLTCKKGTFDINGNRKDVDQDFFLLFSVIDENVSWLLDENINRYCTNPSKAMKAKEDEDFMKANKMQGINGYFYANLPGLNLCIDSKINWHLFGIGNEVDIHTAYFHGQTFTIDSHRKDIASLLPATFVTAEMTTKNPGTWMVNCVVDDHYNDGMYALFNVSRCSSKQPVAPQDLSGKTRTYYIAAEEVIWDYGPSGTDNFIGGKPLNESESESAVFFTRGTNRIGGQYKKALYFEYTDSTFTNKKPVPPERGFLGPVIRAEVGDTIKVVFKNMASRNYSIQPHGVFFNKSNEGALYKDFTSKDAKHDDIVQPNTVYEYVWTVPKESGPTDDDAQCLTWAYYSSLDPVKDTYSGLIGPLLTCRKGALNSAGQQHNIDKEFVLMLMVNDESMSWYHQENKEMFCTNASSVNDDDEDYKESNKMHGINGRLYANLNGLEMCKNNRVSWHLIGFGNEVDMHTVAFYGQTVIENNDRKDTVNLLAGTFTTAIMKPDNVGEWALICKTTDHYSAGMQAKFKVNSCGHKKTAAITRTTRRYYIAAVEIDWDYAPTGRDVLGNKALEDSDHAKTFTVKAKDRIGRVYKKALYREYTDDTFTKEKQRTTDKYLGVLGPAVFAEVGDTIEIVFKNMASRDYSVHPHGVFNSKSNEGSDYLDGSSNADKEDNRIKPNSKYTYKWTVPDRAGPTTDKSSCLTWAYYSDVDSVKDANTGLVGPLIVCNKGTLTEEGKRKDIDRDFALLFTIMDENKSWYLDDNIKKYCTEQVDKDDEDFQESNKMHAINGYLFGNVPGLDMVQGENINWYLLGLGNEVDMHTVHFHGQTFVTMPSSYHHKGHRKDVYDLFPGVFATVKMVPDSVGLWMVHCHVNDHMGAGMEARFEVKEKPTSAPSKSKSSMCSRPSTLSVAASIVLVMWTDLVRWL